MEMLDGVAAKKNGRFGVEARFWLSFALCLPIFALNLSYNFFQNVPNLELDTTLYIQLLLSMIVVFWCGSSFFAKAWMSVTSQKLNMFTLIALAIGVAWFYSLFAMIDPNAFPAYFKNSRGTVPVYFEAASYVTMVVLLGQYLEMKAKMHVQSNLLTNLDQLSGNNLAQLQQLLQKAQQTPTATAKIIDKTAQIFILAVLIIAAIAFILWLNYGPAPRAVFALIVSVSILLAACPCALTLAAPLSTTIALRKALDHSIVINDPNIMEELKTMDDFKRLKNSGQIIDLNAQNLDQIGNAAIVMLDNKNATPSKLLEISTSTMHNIKENLFLGVAYNIISVPLAAGVLYPIWGILLDPVVASVAMSASSVIVILNALRLKKKI